ncbi:MAG: DnaB-like helicase C-terminal domain-containing protein [bacterium]
MQELIGNVFKPETYNINKAIDLFIIQNKRFIDNPLNTIFNFLKGIDEGRFITIGGSSGYGKSALCLQVLYELATQNDDILCIYASAEMTISELTMRLIVGSRIYEFLNMRNVRQYFYNSTEEKINDLKVLLNNFNKKSNFYFLNANRFNLESITRLIELLRKKNAGKRIFVVIDYLQLLLQSSNLNEINTTIKKLKDALVENETNAIVISALNRESTKNNSIDISAFRDSSAIEYTSDIAILMLLKDKNKLYLTNHEINKKEDTLNIVLREVKNRIGKMEDQEFEFYKYIQKFEPLIDDSQEKTKNNIILLEDLK